MSDLILSVDNKHDVTYVGVADIRGTDPTPVSQHDMIAGIMQWLRDLEPAIRYGVVGSIAAEHQVKVQLAKATEEEQRQSENLDRDDVMLRLTVAVAKAAYRPEQVPDKGLYVEVKDVYAELERIFCALPKYVVYTYLKTLEHHTGRVVDLGEGFFVLIEPHTKRVSADKKFAFDVNKIKAMIDQLSEEERDEIQSHVTTSLHGTMYEI